MNDEDEYKMNVSHPPPTHRRARSLDPPTLELHIQPNLQPAMAIVF